jgi:hypothetical protein
VFDKHFRLNAWKIACWSNDGILSAQVMTVEKSPNQLVVVDTMFFGGVAVTVCKRSAVEAGL